MKLFMLIWAFVGVALAEMSQEDKDVVLAHHNKQRALVASGQAKSADGRVQPAAADMQEMVWDDEIAASAQAYVNTCRGGHDPDNWDYGENIASGTEGFYTMAKLTDMWFEELTDSPGMPSDCTVGKFEQPCMKGGVGHYTQVVWANSKKLGCGSKVCNGWINLLCRYGNPGNYYDDAIYQVGGACSKCAQGQSCKNGLCSDGDGAASQDTAEVQQINTRIDEGVSNVASCDVTDSYPDCASYQQYCKKNLSDAWDDWLEKYCKKTCGYC